MKMTSLYIENFGCLHAYRLELAEGLNVICEDNGFGKTTLAAFIRAMLYGLPTTTKKSIEDNERKKYQPWQGGMYGGTLTFSHDGKSYRVERFFASQGTSAKKGDSFVLYDLSTNTVSEDYDENLGMALFGIDADGFQRSAFLPQKTLPDGVDNESITARLNNVIDAGDDTGSYESAVSRLDKKRQTYKKTGNRGLIADLEAELSRLCEEAARCETAGAACAVLTEEAMQTEETLASLEEARRENTKHAEALSAMEETAAKYAHGAALLAERDRLLASAAEKKLFLGAERTPEMLDALYEAATRDSAEVALHEGTLAQDRLLCGEITAQLETLSSLADLPDAEAQSALRSLYDALLVARERASAQTAEAVPTESVKDPQADAVFVGLLSDEELDRHIRQAAAYAAETETLSRPRTARVERIRAYEDAGLVLGTPLPTEEAMDAYANALHTLLKNREEAASTREKRIQDQAEAEALAAKKPDLPDETALVAIRTRYDGLYAQKAEIDALEEKQHAAASRRDDAKKKKTRRLTAGGICLLLGILLAVSVLLFAAGDVRLLCAAAVPAVLGLILLGIGLFGDGDAETRVLDDDIFKRLCEKKAVYEADKTAVYEFLDRCAGTSVLDSDTAEAIFAEAATLCRKQQTLRAALEKAEETLATLDTEEKALTLTLSALRADAAVGSETEDEAAFAVYRNAIRRCASADAAAERENADRARCKARADALHMTLDAYLAQLEASPAARYYTAPAASEVSEGTTQDYLARLTAWKGAAATVRQKEAAQANAKIAVREAEEALSAALAPYAVPEDGDTDVAQAAEAVFAQVSERSAAVAAMKEDLRRTEVRIPETTEKLNAAQKRVDAFLAVFFKEPYPTPQSALATVLETRTTLADEMRRLREQQGTLCEFLSRNHLTEEALQNAASADPTDTEEQRAALLKERKALDARIASLYDTLAAKRHAAETESARAATAVRVKDAILQKKAMLSDAQRAYETVMKTRAFLDEAKVAMSARYLGVMQRAFRAYYAALAGITDAEAEVMTLDDRFLAQIEVGGVRREMGYLSRGTGDLVNLCIRLALIDALYGEDAAEDGKPVARPPLILDDPFVNLDGTRLAKARELLGAAAKRYQILYFVCHESRK